MTSTPKIEDRVRQTIISQPDVILEDNDLLKALVNAKERALGANVVDIRGVAMERMEARLQTLEDAHRTVVAAAYDNLAGMNIIHKAVHAILEPEDFGGFLDVVNGALAEIMRVERVRLIIESTQDEADTFAQTCGNALTTAEPGSINAYILSGARGPVRQVTLRHTENPPSEIYGKLAGSIQSEACLRLDIGDRSLPGLLVLGAGNPELFGPQQGTDLLAFLAGAFERVLRRWVT